MILAWKLARGWSTLSSLTWLLLEKTTQCWSMWKGQRLGGSHLSVWRCANSTKTAEKTSTGLPWWKTCKTSTHWWRSLGKNGTKQREKHSWRKPTTCCSTTLSLQPRQWKMGSTYTPWPKSTTCSFTWVSRLSTCTLEQLGAMALNLSWA